MLKTIPFIPYVFIDQLSDWSDPDCIYPIECEVDTGLVVVAPESPPPMDLLQRMHSFSFNVAHPKRLGEVCRLQATFDGGAGDYSYLIGSIQSDWLGEWMMSSCVRIPSEFVDVVSVAT